MAPRKRNKENEGLPTRWRFRNGTYSYMVPPGQEFRWDGKKEFPLGRNQVDAYKEWSERLSHDSPEVVNTAQLIDRYRLEILPTLGPQTQVSYRYSLERLLPTFGKMYPDMIKPSHANKYYDIQSRQKSLPVAKADVAVLRAMLSVAVRWGVIDSNPLIGQLRLKGAGTRDRYVEDWEVDAALSITPTAGNKAGTSRGTDTCQVYLEFKLATGLRRGDILRLPPLDHNSPIVWKIRKTRKTTGKTIIIDWTPELHDIVRRIETIKPRRIGAKFLFTNRKGLGYYNDETDRAGGFDSIWKRFMLRVVNETAVTESFQEKDIRSKFGSDSESDQDAANKLGHSSAATANKHYRRKPIRFPARARNTKTNET